MTCCVIKIKLAAKNNFFHYNPFHELYNSSSGKQVGNLKCSHAY